MRTDGFVFTELGELYQSVLDEINARTSTATPDAAEMDRMLNFNVLRACGKLLGEILQNYEKLHW